jgi:hypothetical protein
VQLARWSAAGEALNCINGTPDDASAERCQDSAGLQRGCRPALWGALGADSKDFGAWAGGGAARGACGGGAMMGGLVRDGCWGIGAGGVG